MRGHNGVRNYVGDGGSLRISRGKFKINREMSN